MTSYLAVARLTVGADKQTQNRELLEGMDRLVEEMVRRDWTPADIETAFYNACMINGIEPP